MTGFNNHKKLLLPLNSPPSVCVTCKVSSEKFAVFGPKLWWQVPILTGFKNHKKKLSSLNSGPSIFVEFQISSKLKLLQLLLKTIATNEFTTVRNYCLKDGRCQYWQVPNLSGVENHKKLLSLLNSPPSLCAEYEISSKLKHLPFFIQNYGLTDDSCQHWQVLQITKKLFPPVNSPPSICEEYKISSKLKHLLFFVQNYGLKDDRCQHWQVSRITENYCHQ